VINLILCAHDARDAAHRLTVEPRQAQLLLGWPVSRSVLPPVVVSALPWA
jgi:hypothetical protein